MPKGPKCDFEGGVLRVDSEIIYEDGIGEGECGRLVCRKRSTFWKNRNHFFTKKKKKKDLLWLIENFFYWPNFPILAKHQKCWERFINMGLHPNKQIEPSVNHGNIFNCCVSLINTNPQYCVRAPCSSSLQSKHITNFFFFCKSYILEKGLLFDSMCIACTNHDIVLSNSCISYISCMSNI